MSVKSARFGALVTSFAHRKMEMSSEVEDASLWWSVIAGALTWIIGHLGLTSFYMIEYRIQDSSKN